MQHLSWKKLEQETAMLSNVKMKLQRLKQLLLPEFKNGLVNSEPCARS